MRESSGLRGDANMESYGLVWEGEMKSHGLSGNGRRGSNGFRGSEFYILKGMEGILWLKIGKE